MPLLRSLFCLSLLPLVTASAAAVVTFASSTTYVDAAHPDTNYAGQMELKVSPQRQSILRFRLNALPVGIDSSQIVKANLHLWEIPSASPDPIGKITVHRVTSTWEGVTLTDNTMPSFDSTPIAMVSTSVTSNYEVIDITPLVKEWVSSLTSHLGLVVLSGTGADTVDIAYGSKYNTAGSQPPFIDITLATGKTVAVCVTPGASGETGCSCLGTLVSRVTSPGSCTATSDTGTCSASGGPNRVGSCCVCSGVFPAE